MGLFLHSCFTLRDIKVEKASNEKSNDFQKDSTGCKRTCVKRKCEGKPEWVQGSGYTIHMFATRTRTVKLMNRVGLYSLNSQIFFFKFKLQ